MLYPVATSSGRQDLPRSSRRGIENEVTERGSPAHEAGRARLQARAEAAEYGPDDVARLIGEVRGARRTGRIRTA